MPINMPEEARISIRYRHLPADFKMPQMERAESHYTLGYILSGDRHIITPYEQYDAHSGDVTVMPPMLYHRTFPLSTKPYINYLIKISPSLADDFCREIDENIWKTVFEQKHFHFDPDTQTLLTMLLQDMLSIYEKKSPHGDLLLKGALYRLILLIHERNLSTGRQAFHSTLSESVMEAMYYIEQHYEEDIRLRDAASAIGFSDGHFSRLFSSQVGISFSQYLINTRLRHAKELLINTTLPVSEIAIKCGFNNSDYLSACFRKYESTTPTSFRRSALSKES